jgi:hypothetical protein
MTDATQRSKKDRQAPWSVARARDRRSMGKRLAVDHSGVRVYIGVRQKRSANRQCFREQAEVIAAGD